MNPDVEAYTHAKIIDRQGRKQNSPDAACVVTEALRCGKPPRTSISNLPASAFISAPSLKDLAPSPSAFSNEAGVDLGKRSLGCEGLPLDTLDLGGGLGIVYQHENAPCPRIVTQAWLREIIHPLEHKNHSRARPPCWLAKRGCFLTRVEYVKRTDNRRYVILDAGMNDLIRPALYDAHHPIRAVRHGGLLSPCDIVGPVCETGDTFALARSLPQVEEGDLIAIMASGALWREHGLQLQHTALPPKFWWTATRLFLFARGRRFRIY